MARSLVSLFGRRSWIVAVAVAVICSLASTANAATLTIRLAVSAPAQFSGPVWLDGLTLTSPAHAYLYRSNKSSAISRVDYYLDGKLLSKVSASPFTLLTDLSSKPAGNHTLIATAYAGTRTQQVVAHFKTVIAKAPIASDVVWRGDPAAGLKQWSSTHCENSSRISVVTIAGRQAYRMEVDHGDDVTGERCELGQDDDRTRSWNQGADVWEGYSFYLPADFPTNTAWAAVTQWKDQDPDQGSPIWATYVQHGKIEFQSNADQSNGNGTPFSTPATTNVWHNFVIHMKVNSPGLLEIYYSAGDKTPAKVFSGTTDNYRAPSRLVPRMGYYRDPTTTTNNAIYHAGWTIAKSFNGANPLNRK